MSTRGKSPTCHKSPTNFITWCCIEYTSPWAGIELTSVVVMGTDRTGSCKSNYHMITTTKAQKLSWHMFSYERKIYTQRSTYCWDVMLPDRMVDWFTIIFPISAAYHHHSCEFDSASGEVYSIQHYVSTFVSDLWQGGDYLSKLRLLW